MRQQAQESGEALITETQTWNNAETKKQRRNRKVFEAKMLKQAEAEAEAKRSGA